jgi:hypothetical protein
MGDFPREDNDDENQKCFQQERSDQATVGKDSEGSFSGETRSGAGESGTDGTGELLPSRGPLDEEVGSAGKLANGARFEFESLSQVNLKTRSN